MNTFKSECCDFSIYTKRMVSREDANDLDLKITMLDELHKRKIDLADQVLILNVGGYIGESTRSEIEYATKQGKFIWYKEPI